MRPILENAFVHFPFWISGLDAGRIIYRDARRIAKEEKHVTREEVADTLEDTVRPFENGAAEAIFDTIFSIRLQAEASTSNIRKPGYFLLEFNPALDEGKKCVVALQKMTSKLNGFHAAGNIILTKHLRPSTLRHETGHAVDASGLLTKEDQEVIHAAHYDVYCHVHASARQGQTIDEALKGTGVRRYAHIHGHRLSRGPFYLERGHIANLCGVTEITKEQYDAYVAAGMHELSPKDYKAFRWHQRRGFDHSEAFADAFAKLTSGEELVVNDVGYKFHTAVREVLEKRLGKMKDNLVRV